MKRRTRESLAPDITPLIDVVFLLLIFFMVSTVFKKDELALMLSLPKVEQGETEAAVKNQLFIELSPEELAINGKKVELVNLSEQLKEIKDKTVPVELRIDKEVKYDRVIQVLDQLKIYQLTNLSLITGK